MPLIFKGRWRLRQTCRFGPCCRCECALPGDHDMIAVSAPSKELDRATLHRFEVDASVRHQAAKQFMRRPCFTAAGLDSFHKGFAQFRPGFIFLSLKFCRKIDLNADWC